MLICDGIFVTAFVTQQNVGNPKTKERKIENFSS
jgi:hypothetical protein